MISVWPPPDVPRVVADWYAAHARCQALKTPPYQPVIKLMLQQTRGHTVLGTMQFWSGGRHWQTSGATEESLKEWAAWYIATATIAAYRQPTRSADFQAMWRDCWQPGTSVHRGDCVDRVRCGHTVGGRQR